MLFLLPALALTALGLGVKHALDGDLAFAPGDVRWRAAWLAHRDAVAALRSAREGVRAQALALAQLQRRAVDETARPFLELVERLERWECLGDAERLPPATHHALQRLALGPAPLQREAALARALWGAAAEAPAQHAPLLAWLERGWVHADAPVRVEGVCLFGAVACGDVAPAATDTQVHAQQLEAAVRELARARAHLEALGQQLAAHAAELQDVHGCASAQLAYLDAQSFEPGCDELPRARLRRLNALVHGLAGLLQRPLLDAAAALAPPPPLSALPPPVADEA
jgi:hypothetical protein